MIHPKPPPPVFVKRIRLKTWLMRDEIEQALREEIKEGRSAEEINFAALSERYGVSPEEGNPAAKEADKDEQKEEKAGEAEKKEEEESKGEKKEEEESKGEKKEEGGAGEAEKKAEGEAGEAEKKAEGEAGEAEKKEEAPLPPRSSERMPPEKVYDAFAMLSEVNMSSIHFFSARDFLEGQSAVVEFQIPRKFSANVRIGRCRKHGLRTKIISSRETSWRVAGEFTFLHEGERTLLREFISSLAREEEPAEPKAKKDSGGGAVAKPEDNQQEEEKAA